MLQQLTNRSFFRTILVLFIPVIFSGFLTDNTRIQQLKVVRSGFYEAVSDSKKATPLAKKIAKFQSNSSIIKVYEGANYAILAKNKWNPFAAMKLLKKSTIMMNAAVKKSPKNIEIRFIRFAVQKNIPEFLGYSKNINEDKKYIIKNINRFKVGGLSAKMKSYILYFLKEQGNYSIKEIELLEEKLG